MSGVGGAGRKAAYREYLKGEHWAELKARKAKVELKICAACKSDQKIQLHHMLYRDTFEDTRLEDTCWLCKGCHKTYHLRVGVKKFSGMSPAWIKEETIRIVNFNLPPERKKLSRKERRRIRTAIRQQNNRERKALAEENRLKAEAKKERKRPKPEPKIRQAQFNAMVNLIKPRSALVSSLAGHIVVVKPKERLTEHADSAV